MGGPPLQGPVDGGTRVKAYRRPTTMVCRSDTFVQCSLGTTALVRQSTTAYGCQSCQTEVGVRPDLGVDLWKGRTSKSDIPLSRLTASSIRLSAVLFTLIFAHQCVGNPTPSDIPRYLSSGIPIPPLYVSIDGTDSGDCSVTSPCATLLYAVETVAAVASPLSDVVTIVMGPGEYSQSSCGVSASRPLAIIGSGSLNTVVDCGAATRLLSTSSSINISSLTIMNGFNTGDGGAVAVQYTTTSAAIFTATFTDVAVANCTSYRNGGGMFINASSVDGAVVAFRDVQVVNSSARLSGGGVHAYMGGSRSAVSISASSFSGNSAVVGGGVFVMTDGTASAVTLDSCSFFSNTADSDGGGLFIVLSGHSSASTIQESLFTGNGAGGSGGGLYAHSLESTGNSTITCWGCVVTNNSAGGSGGGMCIQADEESSELTFVDDTFSANNASGMGGGVSVTSSGLFAAQSFLNCSFAQNSAVGVGGGIIAEVNGSYSAFHFDGGLVTENSAGSYGGGLAVISLTAAFVSQVISRVVATKNIAGFGGAVYAEADGDNCVITVVNVTSTGNVAPAGYGSLTVFPYGNNASVSIVGCLLIGNTGGFGGGLYLGASGADSVVSIESCTFAGNHADRGGGINVDLWSVDNISILLSDCTFVNNSAVFDGGGAYLYINAPDNQTGVSFEGNSFFSNSAQYGGAVAVYTLTRTACSIALDNCILSSNSATTVGGAVWISTLVDPPLNLLYCDTAASPQFREWEVEFTLRISDTAIVNNSAVCTGTCSAGGVAMSAGGKLIIARSSIVGNVASTFAGGLLLGGTSAGTASCLLSIEDSHIRGNSAQQAGAQVYNNCGGDVSIVNTDIDMDNSNNEVSMPLAGRVSFSNSTLQCPLAAQFVDAFDGLYGPGAYESTFAAPWDGLDNQPYYEEPCQYLTSTLQFGCVPCASGTYSLSAGRSDGTPSVHGNGSSGGVVNPVCEPCPFGGVCGSAGTVVAQPGYWGAVSSDGRVSFAVCPPGYCCPNGESCSSFDVCDGGRTGPLCGDCGPGLARSVLSPVCVGVDRCGQESRVFWLCLVAAIFAMAFVQLLFVSNLLPHIQLKLRMHTKRWLTAMSSRLPSRFVPGRIRLQRKYQTQASGTALTASIVKILMYFSQMSVYVALTSSSVYQIVLDDVRCVLTAQFPASIGGGLHEVCVSPALTALSKAKLSGLLPFAVVAAMLVILLVNRLLTSPPRRGRMCPSCDLRGRYRFERDARQREDRVVPMDGPLDAQGSDGLAHDEGSVAKAACDLECEGTVYQKLSPHGTSPLKISSVHSVPDDQIPQVELDAHHSQMEYASTGLPTVSADTVSKVVNFDLGDDPPPMFAQRRDTSVATPLRSKYIAAVLNFLLTVYSSFLLTIVALLHCVHVPGTDPDSTYLFIQGSTRCEYGGWQSLYVIAAVFLLALPVLIPLATRWAKMQLQGYETIDSQPASEEPVVPAPWKRDLAAGLRDALMSAYIPSLPWWEAVLLLHRLALAFLNTFGSNAPAKASILAVLVCFGFLILHLLARPFAHAKAQRVQTILLVSLSIMAVARVFSSALLQLSTQPDAATAAAIASTATFCFVLNVAFQYAVPAAALLQLLPLRIRWKCRPAAATSY